MEVLVLFDYLKKKMKYTNIITIWNKIEFTKSATAGRQTRTQTKANKNLMQNINEGASTSGGAMVPNLVNISAISSMSASAPPIPPVASQPVTGSVAAGHPPMLSSGASQAIIPNLVSRSTIFYGDCSSHWSSGYASQPAIPAISSGIASLRAAGQPATPSSVGQPSISPMVTFPGVMSSPSMYDQGATYSLATAPSYQTVEQYQNILGFPGARFVSASAAHQQQQQQ